MLRHVSRASRAQELLVCMCCLQRCSSTGRAVLGLGYGSLRGGDQPLCHTYTVPLPVCR